MIDAPTSSTAIAEAEPLVRAPKRRRRIRSFGKMAIVFLFLAGVGLAGAEYYTSRASFCGSCHIMQPYYKSWLADSHGALNRAACVDCHYAPGEQHTPMAKLKGLSQLTSYFSGRAGAGRPKAQVDDASCLATGCHDNRAFMTVDLRLSNVTFNHATHLDPDGKRLDEERVNLANRRASLSTKLGPDRFAAIEAIAQTMQPAEEIAEQLTAWLADRNYAYLQDDVLAYAEGLHMDVRIGQLAGLKCSSCHQYDSTSKKHFTVARTTCYTCHFTNQPFNGGTGTCLSCHEPPTTLVPVHGKRSPANGSPSTSVVMMNHTTIIENDVDCASCHVDLIRGTGQVTRRDCQNCHDQAHYLRDFTARTTQTVREYHRVHAAGQRARCNDCHAVIEHQLMPLGDPGDTMSLLAPVREECRHCHPEHHRSQVELFLGRGGFSASAAGVPNPMTGSRVSCRACHTDADGTADTGAVIRGTLESCRACHSEDYKKLYAGWRQSIDARHAEVTELLADAREQLDAATRGTEKEVAAVKQRVERASGNLRLVTTANGIHNRNYAMMLLDQAIIDLDAALATLSK